MVRLPALASLLLSLVVPSSATSAPLAKEAEINGVRLSYIEKGSGEPIVFVHGAFSDLRVWEPVWAEIAKREEIANKYRLIAYTQRYHGVGAWKDDGKEYSVATHVDDLAKFITSLNAGPVHLVGRSGGGGLAMRVAVKNPALVRTLIVHEPALMSVLPEDSEEGKAARSDQAKVSSAAMAANKAGDSIQAARLFMEGVYQLEPGGFDRLLYATRTMLLDNARTAADARRAAATTDHVRGAEERHAADAGDARGEREYLPQADQ